MTSTSTSEIPWPTISHLTLWLHFAISVPQAVLKGVARAIVLKQHAFTVRVALPHGAGFSNFP